MSYHKQQRRATWAVAACAVAGFALSSSADRVARPVIAATAEAKTGPAPIFTIPPSYRDWRFISVATLASPVSDIRAKLGNDAAIAAFREKKVPYPNGAIIARLAWKQVTFKDSTDALRTEPFAKKLSPAELELFLNGSIVAGPATTVQFMVKDSNNYASTGGWGFFQATNGKLDTNVVQTTCFACHASGGERDFVFTRYSP